MWLNVKEALRRLARAPSFSLVAVGMLGLTIGVCTASFSITNTLLLRPANFPAGERLVRIFRTNAESDSNWHSPANYLYLQEHAKSFEQIASFHVVTENIGRVGEAPEVQFGVNFTANALTTLRINPILGRGFAPGEDEPGKDTVVMLTKTYWEQHYGGDPKLIGQTLRVDARNVVVIGILPDFDSTTGWYNAKFVQPNTIWPGFATTRSAKWFNVFARLKPGVSVREAGAELSVLASQIDREFPADNGNDGLRVTTLGGSELDGKTRQTYWLTVGLSALVLIIGCANLANVQLARFLSRAQDFAVRTSLGASRADLMKPLLVESIILTLLGAAVGVMLAFWTNRLVSHAFYGDIPFDLDLRVLGFALAVSIATGLTFGLAPAWLAAGTSSATALKEMSNRTTTSRRHQRIKSLLIIGQIASALVLVCTALSFTLAVQATIRKDRGWSSAALYSAFIDINRDEYKTDDLRRQFYQKLRDGLATVPGVTEVTLTTNQPVYGNFFRERLLVEGRPPEPVGSEQPVSAIAIDPDYFSLLKIRLRTGVAFSSRIKADDPRVAIINQTMARLYWPDGDAMGKRIRLVGEETWCEIVGVAADVQMNPDFNSPYSKLQVYRPLIQFPSIHNSILLRTTLPDETVDRSVHRVLSDIDPNLMLKYSGNVERHLNQMFSENDLMIYALGVFAALGLLIALVGIYSVIDQSAAQRAREFGIRIALGATYLRIIRLVLGQAAVLIGIGVAIGLFATFHVIALLQTSMPELQLPNRAVEFAIAALLALTAIAAACLPARRAIKVSPVECLRAE